MDIGECGNTLLDVSGYGHMWICMGVGGYR